MQRRLAEKQRSDAAAEHNDFAGLTLEEVFTGADYANLPASPLQTGICRASEGRPIGDALVEEEIDRFFGEGWTQPEIAIAIVVLVCGVRGGKSFLASCAAIHAALTCPMTKDGRKLKKQEVARVPIIGPDVDAATKTFVILTGIIDASPKLRAAVDGEPTSDTIVLRRPDGYRVEIKVVAASKGGRTVRGSWLCGFILEEVAQIGQESTGAVVAAEPIYKAAITRLLDGCQGWLISSPYGPQGLLYELWRKHFGQPGDVLVVHAPTREMNPSFPQSDIDRIARTDPDTAAREYGAEWLDAETAYYPSVSIDSAQREAPLERPRPAGAECFAAGDFATRGNAWTLVVGTVEEIADADDPNDAFEPATQTKVSILAGWEWIGSQKEPLSPRDTCAKMAECLAPYGVTDIACDQWSFDAIKEHAEAASLTLHEVGSSDRETALRTLRTTLTANGLELPPNEGTGAVMRTDLLAARQRANAGSVKVVLPRQANGRHCDFVPAIALLVHAVGTTLPSDAYHFRSLTRRPVNLGLSAVLNGDALNSGRGLGRGPAVGRGPAAGRSFG